MCNNHTKTPHLLQFISSKGWEQSWDSKWTPNVGNERAVRAYSRDYFVTKTKRIRLTHIVHTHTHDMAALPLNETN